MCNVQTLPLALPVQTGLGKNRSKRDAPSLNPAPEADIDASPLSLDP